MKENKFQSISLSLLLMVSMIFSVSLVSCSDEHAPDNPDNPPVVGGRQTIEAPVALLSPLPDGFYGIAIDKATPLRSSLEDASVAIISGLDLRATDKDKLNAFLEKGGIVVVVNPDDRTDDVLRDDLGDYVHPYDDDTKALAFAFDKNDRYFIVHSESIEIQSDVDLEILSDEEFNSLQGKMDEGETDDDESVFIDGEQDSEGFKEDDGDYYNRIEFLIEWINRLCREKTDESRSFSTRDASGDIPKLDISTYFAEVSYAYDFNLRHQLEKAASSKPDSLIGSGTIMLTIKEYPLYVFDVPDQGASVGEYYIIDGTIEARNNDLWHPDQFTHGKCASRLVGYYMENINMEAMLVNGEDSLKELKNVKFAKEPIPTTSSGSTTYTEGFNWSINGSVSGKFTANEKGLGGEIGASVGFQVGWSNSQSTTLENCTATVKTHGESAVGYQFDIHNIQNKMKWEDDWARRYPDLCRGTFSRKICWIWRLPPGSNDIRNDHEHEAFLMKVKLGAKYGAYSWWRGGSKGHKHQFTVNGKTEWLPLEAPSHASFGYIALQNAHDYTLANIKIVHGNDTVVVPNAYFKDQEAKKAVKTGTYSVIYDFVDTKKGNRLISKWQYDNVKVNISNKAENATTRISTADAAVRQIYP